MRTGEKGKMTRPNNKQNTCHDHQNDNRIVKPPLAILQIQPSLSQIAQQLGLPRELLAKQEAHVCLDGRNHEAERRDGAKGEICDGVVAVEANVRW